MHIDNKGKDILIYDDGATQGLDDTTSTTEAKYPISFTYLYLVYTIMEAIAFYLLILQKYIHLKQKGLEWKITYCVISKDFWINNIKKTGIKGFVKKIFCWFQSYWHKRYFRYS